MVRHFIPVMFIILALLTGCSAKKKALKKAYEYEEAELYVEAAEQDLKALSKDSNYKDAKIHLRQIAPMAYTELLGQARNLEQAKEWDETVDAYKYLDSFLGRLHQVGIVLKTINVNKKLGQSKHKAAEFHYRNAENLFARQHWNKAANAYLKANGYVDHFNQSFDKAIQSLVNAGDRWLEQKEFRKALNSYQRILDLAANHPVAKAKIVEAQYSLGKQLFDEGQFRQALTEFENAHELNPDYKDLAKWTDRAYEEAVQYTAVFPFQNRSNVGVDGYFIAREILNRALRGNLKFAEFLSHPETVSLVNTFGYARTGRINEGQLLQAARDEGFDSIVWGIVQRVDVDDAGPDHVEYEDELVTTDKDSAGKEVEHSQTIYYREYTMNRRVKVTVELLFLETETGAVLKSERFSDNATDVAKWISYQGSIYDLPKKKRPLLDAPRDPRPVPEMVHDLLLGLSDRMGRRVIKFYR